MPVASNRYFAVVSCPFFASTTTAWVISLAAPPTMFFISRRTSARFTSLGFPLLFFAAVPGLLLLDPSFVVFAFALAFFFMRPTPPKNIFSVQSSSRYFAGTCILRKWSVSGLRFSDAANRGVKLTGFSRCCRPEAPRFLKLHHYSSPQIQKARRKARLPQRAFLFFLPSNSRIPNSGG